MAGTAARRYGSTAKTRAQVLEALGVVKIATASQIRMLMCPGTADAGTVRGGAKDLEAEGLVLSAGRTSRVEPDGRRITEKLWSLTPAGLEAAAVVLDRPVREMGGTAKAAAASGAKHAGRVTDTLAAFLQTPPEPTTPVLRKGVLPAPAPAPDERLPGLGPIAGWSTEVSLPVTGSFAAPGRGSLRADLLFAMPGGRLPLLFVEVDNGTESPAVLAEKIHRYQRFFARTVTQGGRETVLWRTLWTTPASRELPHPPVAIVFTKRMGAAAMETRMREVARLSEPAWKGRWTTGHTTRDGAPGDGYRDYQGTVPVLVTVLDRLQEHGPHGPTWWRYGHQNLQTLQSLTDALDDPDDHRAYAVREQQRRAAADAARERQQEERGEERRRREAAAWPCPQCGRKVYPPGDEWSDGAEPGSLCAVCQSRADRDAHEAQVRAEEQAELDRQARADGWRGWLGR
ncbi:replication-relaxation family protein [Streptomyces erythrochromogenes]|uniref:replication-relaxation family protein n=1 Tax=Streptomyces erythrochromogenes TaxID=285574 RepID=UPI00381031E8